MVLHYSELSGFINVCVFLIVFYASFYANNNLCRRMKISLAATKTESKIPSGKKTESRIMLIYVLVFEIED